MFSTLSVVVTDRGDFVEEHNPYHNEMLNLPIHQVWQVNSVGEILGL